MSTYEVGVRPGRYDTCPACEHLLISHYDSGCEESWQWDEEGVATVIGCECVLSIAPDHRH
jgi:hypothetical protein